MTDSIETDEGSAQPWVPQQTEAPSGRKAVPINMVLYCPNCGKQHVDAPDTEPCKDQCQMAQDYGFSPSEGHSCSTGCGYMQEGSPRWTNPPHRSHLCHNCGCIWRPADVPTNGVAHIETKGNADTWVGKAAFAAPAEATQPTQAEVVLIHGVPVHGLLPEDREPMEAIVDAAYAYAKKLRTQPTQAEAPQHWKPTDAVFAEWCERHDMHPSDRQAFDDAATLHALAVQPAQAEATTQRLDAPDFGPCPTISRGDPEAAWSHGCLTGYRTALATQQAVQGEPVALSENPITARAQVVSMRIKARDKDPYHPGNDVPATPPAPGQVERINLSTFAWGVTRMGDNPKAVLVSFRSEPTDDDLRALHEALRPASGRTVHANAAQPGQVERDREAIAEDPISEAMRRYLKVCRSGGLSGKKSREIQAHVENAERLNYFKLIVAHWIANFRAARSNEGDGNE